jgi:hypothetical protein
MMTRTLVASLVLVTAAALVAAGCGGGGGGGSKPLTKAAFAAKADAACAAAQAKGTKLDLSTTEKIAANGDEAKNILDELANKIDDLDAPDALQDSAQSFVDGLRQEVSQFDDMTQAAKDGDTSKVRQIQQKLQSESAATSEDARFVGATGCARLFA